MFYRENEALWREVANLRQKHMKQQQIVNKVEFTNLTFNSSTILSFDLEIQSKETNNS